MRLLIVSATGGGDTRSALPPWSPKPVVHDLTPSAQVAAMFVQGSVTYDDEEATFIAVAEDGHGWELFVDETVGYDENTDAFGIRTGQ